MNMLIFFKLHHILFNEIIYYNLSRKLSKNITYAETKNLFILSQIIIKY